MIYKVQGYNDQVRVLVSTLLTKKREVSTKENDLNSHEYSLYAIPITKPPTPL
jgi:hypothetical protein